MLGCPLPLLSSAVTSQIGCVQHCQPSIVYGCTALTQGCQDLASQEASLSGHNTYQVYHGPVIPSQVVEVHHQQDSCLTGVLCMTSGFVQDL